MLPHTNEIQHHDTPVSQTYGALAKFMCRVMFSDMMETSAASEWNTQILVDKVGYYANIFSMVVAVFTNRTTLRAMSMQWFEEQNSDL